MSYLIKPLLLLLLLAAGPLQAASAIIPRPPQLAATSYILMDAASGRIIVEENADEALPPASLTKIMTTYIAMEEILYGNLTLQDTARISQKAAAMQGSDMFLSAGTEVTLEDLLRGIIVQSGNDASVAIAEYIAGSEDVFADLMNQYSERLGLSNSHFMNSSGYDTEDNYNTMSARDLAVLAQATVTRHAALYPMYAEPDFTYAGIFQRNRNNLLFRDSSVDGIKTGHTEAAGYCLVASAQRGDMRLISVVMGAASEEARAAESQKLLTYGFRFYETYRMFEEGTAISNVRVWSGLQEEVAVGVAEDVYITIPRGHGDSLRAVLELPSAIHAPLVEGQVLGTVNVSMAGAENVPGGVGGAGAGGAGGAEEETLELLYSAEVMAMGSVQPAGLFKRFNDWLTLVVTGGGGGSAESIAR